MLLENKTAIVYGGAGSIGSAVARVFAGEGATVHLVGRTQAPLEELAGTIAESGGVSRSRHSTRLTAPRSSSTPLPSPGSPRGSTSPSTPLPTTTCTAPRWSTWPTTTCCAPSSRQSPPT
ncbi:SDR family NAD(P)-dependent oxidoreductase [Streptomyces sp. NPDC005566]|uniref:SDR family NAD(P)-dependent oxidoreductase n=1 Tax=Streptomyces sp. NPDC005566 TaxID=3156886 RepID=UPI0033A0A215